MIDVEHVQIGIRCQLGDDASLGKACERLMTADSGVGAQPRGRSSPGGGLTRVCGVGQAATERFAVPDRLGARRDASSTALITA